MNMVDHSGVKVGSLYWIRYKYGAENDPKTWVEAWRMRGICGGFHWSTRYNAYVQDSAVTHIGPEIVPPPEPRKPGIYRVKFIGDWTAAEFDGTDWWIAGSKEDFHATSFEIIGDYLGPVEPSTEVAS